MNQLALLRRRAALGLKTYPTIIWVLAFGCLVNVGGLSLLWPVNAIYMHTVLGKSVTVSGVVLMLYSAAGFVGSSIGGWLYDRIGAVRTLAGALLLSCLVILIPAFVTSWWAYVVVMMAFGMTCSAPFAALNALAGQAWPQGGRRAFNFLYVANNLGVAVGTALGGILAETSFRSVFVGIAVAYAVFLMVVLFILRPQLSAVETRRQDVLANNCRLNARYDESAEEGLEHPGRGAVLKEAADEANSTHRDLQTPIPWLGIGGILFGFMVAWVVYVQWQVTISVYMQALGYPLSSYSILWTLNGILIFASQPLVSLVNKRFSKLHSQMVGGILLYVLSFGLLILSHSYTVFVTAMVLTTLGEVFVWPSVPAAIAVLVPSHRAGFGQGMVQSAATLGRMFGPLYGGWLYDQIGMPHMVYYLLPVLVLSILCFLMFRTRDSKTKPYGPSGVAA